MSEEKLTTVQPSPSAVQPSPSTVAPYPVAPAPVLPPDMGVWEKIEPWLKRAVLILGWLLL